MNFPQPIWHFYYSKKIFDVNFKEVFNNIKFVFFGAIGVLALFVIYSTLFNDPSVYIRTVTMSILFLLYLICLIPEKQFVKRTVFTVKNTISKVS